MEWQFKLERVLAILLEDKFPHQIDQHLEKLLSYFQKQEAKELKSALITHPIFTKWIKESISKWSANKMTPPVNIASFTLNLGSYLSKNEEIFCELNANNFYIKMVTVLKVRQSSENSITVDYINLLSAFLEHKSGIEWMTASNFWEDMYKLTLSEKNEKIISESTIFMTKLLESTIDHDEEFCDNVVQKIMMPLGENIYKTFKAANDELILRYHKSTLQLIGNILQQCLDGIYLGKKDFGLPFLFLKNFHLEERISDFMVIAQTRDLHFDIARIMYIMQFLEVYVKTLSKSVIAADVISTAATLRNNFLLNISKDDFDQGVANFCNFGIMYWSLFESKFPFVDSKKKLSLKKEFIYLLTTSTVGVIVKHCCKNLSELEENFFSDETRAVFSSETLKILSNDLIRVCFKWRDKLLTNPNLFKICCKCLEHVKNSRKYFSNPQGINVFQILIYILTDIISSIKKSPTKIDLFTKEPQFFALIFEILRLCVEEFHIKWRDSCETIEVMNLCCDYLTLPDWPSVVVIEIFKLIRTAFVNHMSPNLALLVDDAADSPITLLGPLLYSKLLDKEVKMVAIEVVDVLIRLSNGFLFIQKILVDSELPALVAKMAFCDEDIFIRVMSIKCLQGMIQVHEIWKDVLEIENLLQQMLHILHNSTDGIICAEATTFINIAYDQHLFSQEDVENIYEVMIDSIATNSHWEVKMRALSFWNKVINNSLQNEGMIDGSFPSVTFSKEHRKIITLTESEIRKRILKVLKHLSSIGCLGVLISITEYDFDTEVAKAAVKIIENLADLVKKYNVKCDCDSPASVSSRVSLDEVMELVRADFCEDTINSTTNSDVDERELESDYGSRSNSFGRTKIVSLSEFLQFCQQDFSKLLINKNNWLNGIEDLPSLLEDFLNVYEISLDQTD